MENSLSVTITPIQALLGLAFQIWIIVFPIILIRKINYLTALIASQNTYDDESGDGSESG